MRLSTSSYRTSVLNFVTLCWLTAESKQASCSSKICKRILHPTDVPISRACQHWMKYSRSISPSSDGIVCEEAHRVGPCPYIVFDIRYACVVCIGIYAAQIVEYRWITDMVFFFQRTRDGLWKCMLFFTPFVPRHWWWLKPASVPITRFWVGIDTNVEWLDEVNPCQINCIQRLIFDCKFLHMPFGGEIFFSLREMLVDHHHQPFDEMAYYSAALDAGGDSSNWPRLTHTHKSQAQAILVNSWIRSILIPPMETESRHMICGKWIKLTSSVAFYAAAASSSSCLCVAHFVYSATAQKRWMFANASLQVEYCLTSRKVKNGICVAAEAPAFHVQYNFLLVNFTNS